MCGSGHEASLVVFEVLGFLSYLGVLYVIDIYFGPGQERSQELGTQYPRKNPAITVLGYAVRFLKHRTMPQTHILVLICDFFLYIIKTSVTEHNSINRTLERT